MYTSPFVSNANDPSSYFRIRSAPVASSLFPSKAEIFSALFFFSAATYFTPLTELSFNFFKTSPSAKVDFIDPPYSCMLELPLFFFF